MRVIGPYGLDRNLRVKGDFTLIVTQPGSYRLYFGNVRQGEWLYPSDYRKTVNVPEKAGNQKVSVGYQRARLRFDGVGRLRVGMTYEQASLADPSVKAELEFECLLASSRFADLFFNPNGKLSMIVAKPGIRTVAGVQQGSSYSAARKAYGFTRTSVSSQHWDYIRVAPDYRARAGKEASRKPLLGVEFDSGSRKNAREFYITRSKVSNLFIDAGQTCVS